MEILELRWIDISTYLKPSKKILSCHSGKNYDMICVFSFEARVNRSYILVDYRVRVYGA